MRYVVLTAALALTGGLVGAALGAVLWIVALGPLQALLLPEGLWLAVSFGAIIGGILTPVTGWLLLRDVPLGLAVGGTALGTVAGAVAGLMLGGWGGSAMFAVAGFFAAALLLRSVASQPRGRVPAHEPA